MKCDTCGKELTIMERVIDALARKIFEEHGLQPPPIVQCDACTERVLQMSADHQEDLAYTGV